MKYNLRDMLENEEVKTNADLRGEGVNIAVSK